MAKIVRFLALAYCTVVSIIIAASYVMIVLKAPTLMDGFIEVGNLMSPFNVINNIAVLLSFAPGAGLFMFSEYLKKKKRNSPDG